MFTRKEALTRFGSDYKIKKKVESGQLYMLDKCVYSMDPDVPPMAVYTFRYPHAVLTMDSAFYFYGLTDVIPDEYSLATKRNSPPIKDRKIKQYYVDMDFFPMGAEETEYRGYPIRIYSLERMLVELVRYKSKIPLSYYKELIQSFREKTGSLDMQEVQDIAMAAPKCEKIMDVIQMEVL